MHLYFVTPCAGRASSVNTTVDGSRLDLPVQRISLCRHLYPRCDENRCTCGDARDRLLKDAYSCVISHLTLSGAQVLNLSSVCVCVVVGVWVCTSLCTSLLVCVCSGRCVGLYVTLYVTVYVCV